MEEKKVENPTIRKEEKEEKLPNTKMTITVDLERIFDPNRSQNNLMMVLDAACINDDEGKPVADVLHGIPCHTVIRDKSTKEDWVLNYLELFKAYEEERQKLEG